MEQIAVLDGLGNYLSPTYGQDYSEFSRAREVTPVPGGGQNYTGGSDWFSRAPYRLQQEGLAGIGSLGVEPGGWDGHSWTPEPSSGANYQGGSNWHPYAPTTVSSEGLAGSLSIDVVPGYAGSSETPVPGNGANYTGGSDWTPGFPTTVSSNGLVGTRMRGLGGPVPAPSSRDFMSAARYSERTMRDVKRWISCAATSALSMIYGQTLQGRMPSSALVNQWSTRIYALGFSRGVALTRDNVMYYTALEIMSQLGYGSYARGSKALRASALAAVAGARRICG